MRGKFDRSEVDMLTIPIMHHTFTEKPYEQKISSSKGREKF